MRGRTLGLLGVVAVAACRPSVDAAQPAAVAIEPAALTPGPRSCVAASAPVRLWADDGYRAGRADWRRDATAILAAAGPLLAADACLTLTVLEAREWSGRHDDLEAALTALETADRGDGAAWVLGLTAALPAATTVLDQLALARPLGKQVVLRAIDPALEAVALPGLAARPAGERAALVARFASHKATVALLHGLGHALGAVHVTDETLVMAPAHAAGQARYGDGARRRFAAVAPARAAGDLAAFRAALGADLLADEWSGWNVDEIAALRASLAEAPASADRLGAGVRADDREQLAAARRLLEVGQASEAREILIKLRELYPSEPAVIALDCRAAARLGEWAASRERCAPVARESGDPALFRAALEGALAAKDPAAGALVDEAAAAVAARADAGPAEWAEVAAMARLVGRVRVAEDAAARAGDKGREVADWAKAQRARWAMPRDAVPAAREPETFAALERAIKDVYGGRHREAEAALVRLERDGAVAAAHAIRCDLEIRKRDYPAARAACRRAIEVYRDAGWAHYLLGLLDQRDKQIDRAIGHLERAVALIPDVKDPWKVLAGLYRQAGLETRLEKLAAEHKTRHGAPL